jgi:hypothetical protein
MNWILEHLVSPREELRGYFPVYASGLAKVWRRSHKRKKNNQKYAQKGRYKIIQLNKTVFDLPRGRCFFFFAHFRIKQTWRNVITWSALILKMLSVTFVYFSDFDINSLWVPCELLNINYLKLGCLHLVACVRSGSVFGLDGNPWTWNINYALNSWTESCILISCTFCFTCQLFTWFFYI